MLRKETVDHHLMGFCVLHSGWEGSNKSSMVKKSFIAMAKFASHIALGTLSFNEPAEF